LPLANPVIARKTTPDAHNNTMTQFTLRPLKKPRGLHTNDTIHKSIRLCPLAVEILDTPQLQRLRKLKQLGTSEYTYVNANHTRFEHSLGVAHLSEEILTRIRNEQPALGITDLDVVCVKIAGLCHDIGHGPFSHIFDGDFRKQIRVATKNKRWMGRAFDVSAYEGLQELPDGWAHEDDSLMMIDALLRGLGLAIDEDRLDFPLKQIGDGIDAKQFGIVDSSSGKFVAMTSRDWIFIKECIAGGPLPKNGMSIDSLKKSHERLDYVGRMDPNKEFLYDVVSNRHSGFDFDKGDYLARDKFYCFGFKGFEQSVLARLFDNACVAWGTCANPKKCFRCKHNTNARGEPVAGKHLTV
jgi:HD superfamily phosphohydrolase